jgi:YfiH family protein
VSEGSGGAFDVTSQAGVDVLRWRLFEGLALDAVVTTCQGGVSTGPYASLNLGLHVDDDPVAVAENRRRAAAAVGLEPNDLVFCNQTHGREVAVVGEAHRGRGLSSMADVVAEADAMVSITHGLGLVVLVADCVPMVLYDPEAHVVAVVHAGWRGTVAGVCRAAVGTMVALGARPDRILAGLGPAVAPERYQVGDEVVAAARDALGRRVKDAVFPDGTGRWLFDLWAANLTMLVEAGVRPERIAVASVPTGDGQFFSDRAERPCGRFGAIAVLRPR